jgi:ATP-dependent phosphoenolpyruvate carboxykinase
VQILQNYLAAPLIVYTGKFTGRSPKDRYFVKTADNENLELIFLSGSNHGYR